MNRGPRAHRESPRQGRPDLSFLSGDAAFLAAPFLHFWEGNPETRPPRCQTFTDQKDGRADSNQRLKGQQPRGVPPSSA